MLTKDEKNFLKKISANQNVKIFPYDKKIPEIVDEFSKKICSVLQEVEIAHLGASSLGISGQGDIDLSILCQRSSFEGVKAKLIPILGEPIKEISLTEWRFERLGHEISIYLTDPQDTSTARQIKVQKILSQNIDLLKEYERLKEKSASLGYREYQRQKYEFYNKILKYELS